MTEAADPVATARRLADEVLRPQAEQVDLTVVSRSTLDLLAEAGLLGLGAPAEGGGGGQPASVVRDVAEVLAGACGATWFVWTQHAMPLATVLASPNEALRSRLLPGLATGGLLAGVAVAHVRRPGRAVTATRTDGGWRFDGHVGWMTSWGICDVLLLAAVTADDELVFALVDAREQPGLTAGRPMRLAAMSATRTVTLDLGGLVVPDAAVAEVTDLRRWQAADRCKTANAGPHTFGLQREVTRRLAETAERRGDGTASELARGLAEEGAGLREQAYRLLDDVPADEQVEQRLAVRAAALELTVRSAAALVTATGGSAMSLDAAAQRLAREALFHLVQAQTPAVREATLTEMGEVSRSRRLPRRPGR